jgi:acetyl-CoA acetyltransferase
MSQKDDAVILGAGTTATFTEQPDRTRTSLIVEALENATDDAGIRTEDIDGFITNKSAPYSRDYDRLFEELGMDVPFNIQLSSGRWTGTALQQAAMAIESGLAEYVAVGVGIKFNSPAYRSTNENINLAETGSLANHTRRPWYGMADSVGGTGLATRYYLEKYGADTDDLGHVAVSLRRNASENPTSIHQDPISLDEYRDSPWTVQPLRQIDRWAKADGGAFLILTNTENASESDSAPVSIAAQRGVPAGRDEYLFSRPGLGIRTQTEGSYDAAEAVDSLFGGSDLSLSDVDGLYTYDAFTSVIWFVLERWGFCGPGEAFEFTRDGEIEVDGRLPINTNGGSCANGHLVGWNQIVEMYDQLQGRCGSRQVTDAETMMWATTFGDAVVLRRDD